MLMSLSLVPTFEKNDLFHRFAAAAAEAGANVLVAGSAVFKANVRPDASFEERVDNYSSAIKAIRSAAARDCA